MVGEKAGRVFGRVTAVVIAARQSIPLVQEPFIGAEV
jgi:hypothetical protein